MLKSFKVYGSVQGVMFRQTFIRGLINRGFNGGASNIKDREKTVNITIEARNKNQIREVIDTLLELKVINSWKAKVERIIEIENINLDDHEVTTKNVNEHKWSGGVDFYF